MKFKTSYLSVILMLGISALGLSIPELSYSATIEEYTDSDMGCRLRLSGIIELGDADILEVQIKDVLRTIPDRNQSYYNVGAEQYPTFAVCLDSPGGSLKEGVHIAQILYEYQISSAVPENAICESACAVAFMGGARDASNDDQSVTIPHRLLNPRGRLGFHAPSLNIDDGQFTAEQLNTAFRSALDGIEAVLRLVTEQQINFPTPLLVSMLETPPSDMFYIDTIYQANRWLIIVHPVAYPARDPVPALTHVCLNADVAGTDISRESIRSWLDWLFDPSSRDSVLRPELLTPDASIDQNIKAYAAENFPIRVLPLWSFTDAMPSTCVVSRDLLSAITSGSRFTSIHPFQFYSPETLISGLPASDASSQQRLVSATAALYSKFRSNNASSCWLTSPIARITNVSEYVNLRREPDFAASIVRGIPLAEQVRLISDMITVIGQERDRVSCINACRAFDANREDGTARDPAQQCINDNMLWYEIADTHGNRGWVSRKFLEDVE